MKRLINSATLFCSIFTLIFVVLYLQFETDIFKTLAITFGVTLYHFLMRLVVGFVVGKIATNSINYNAFWFQSSKAEQNLYKIIKIKRLKKHMPTYNPETFDLEKNNPEQILQNICVSELVHEVIVVLSFAPIIATVWFGSFIVFFTTSLLAALVDFMFVFIQRYNRPRIVRLMTRKN